MLMVREVAGSAQVIARIKRKVRLASGLDEHFVLSQEAMGRGWECLALFAERLQDVPPKNIRIVATATLRLAVNAADFVAKARSILNHDISIISGEQEAATIYLGVAHTSNSDSNRLVIDIGGASTEVIIGNGFNPLVLSSLNIGCVTFLERYFTNDIISQTNFDKAITAAQHELSKLATEYLDIGWLNAVGASGTVQAIQEILVAQGYSEEMTLARIEQIKCQAIECQSIDKLRIKGLVNDRRLVFVSGLAILIAIFKTLKVERMTLAGGALREGLLYNMMDNMQRTDIRVRTLNSLLIRYHIDQRHCEIVAEVARNCASQLKDSWQLDKYEGLDMLNSAALLHELGLIVEYRHYHRHGAYILNESELPGFTRAQHKLVTALVSNHRGAINHDLIAKQTMTSCQLAERLTRLLRVAVILSMRRLDEVLPPIKVIGEADKLTLQLPDGWLKSHPLMKAELATEIDEQKSAGWTLLVTKITSNS
ncbi:MAG: exopolyphosphatase/guanosine-5'-triphosphate,3'-diphosphate pyrophosphatase [Alteromonadaceae bacterium]|jgi:exopolyphosphatase/guanosine-5'-triphosphate,3'-diphosphate pyrophosphatase